MIASAARPSLVCPSCGAPRAFVPGRSALVCSGCGSEDPLSPPTTEETARALKTRDWAEAVQRSAAAVEDSTIPAVVCGACGAATRFDAHVLADRCAFCASPLRREPTPHEQRWPPQAVVPFRLDAGQAQAAFARWVSTRALAPDALKDTVRRADGIRGVYLPWWTFDAATRTAFHGERGEDRQVRHGRDDRRTETTWTGVQGSVNVDFRDLMVAGSPSIPARLLGVLDRGGLEQARPLAEPFLAGFTVEVDRLGLQAAFEAARRQMDGPIDAAIRRAIGGDRQRIHARQTEVDSVRLRHLLLPVWIGAYRFRGKAYQVVVHGCTGHVAGDRPWSVWKIALLVAAVLLLLAVFQGVIGWLPEG